MHKHKNIFYMKNLLFVIGIILAFCLFSCSSKNQEIDNDITQLEEIEKEEKLELPEFRSPEITYRLIDFESASNINDLLSALPDSIDRKIARKIIMTLNRKEIRFMKKDEKIIIPNIFTNNLLDYSILPHNYPAGKNLEQLIIVSIDKQAYACYEYGNLVRFAATNTGKEKTPSFPGRYALVWKDRLRRSSLDSTWIMPFTFNFHSEAGSAFHQFQMPGRPVSHSCLRQFLDDAEWLYNWGKGAKRDSLKRTIPMSGTPVILLNTFDYSRATGGPWLEFTSNHDGKVEMPEDPMAIEEALIPIQQIPVSSRGALRNRERYVYAEDTLRARGIIRDGIVLTPSVDFNLQRRLKLAAEYKKKKEEEKRRALEIDSNDDNLELLPDNKPLNNYDDQD